MKKIRMKKRMPIIRGYNYSFKGKQTKKQTFFNMSITKYNLHTQMRGRWCMGGGSSNRE
jgi:predicted GH43/DUF377 family glycosyl hydrolase